MDIQVHIIPQKNYRRPNQSSRSTDQAPLLVNLLNPAVVARPSI